MMRKANEFVATHFYSEDGVSADRQRFVDNLGWLLSQTNLDVLDVCLQNEGTDEVVRVIYQNSSDRCVSVKGLGYLEIVKEVVEFVSQNI